MAIPPKDAYFESGSLAKPPRFNADNFSLWKSRMELFLSGSDPQIPYFIEHGPYVPTSIIPAVAATTTSPAVPERTFIKQVSNWTDEDKRLVNVDNKARSLIAMSLPDEVITKFMEALPEYWENYTMCLKMSKDIKTITLSELYGMMLNHEQTKSLKTNLIRDTKDVKSTSLALVFDTAQPSQTPVSTVTITEIEDSDSEPVFDNETELNESLALLSKHFKKFGRKGNFRKSKPLSIAKKPETPSGDKATSTCFKCQSKGHFATECRYKKNQFAETSTPASKDGKYQKLKAKNRVCSHAQLEDIPKEEVPATPSSTSALPLAQVSTHSLSDTMTAMDALTIDLYNALNVKSTAEKVNFDLRTELKECHEKLKELAKGSRPSLKEKKLSTKLNSEKVTVKSWADASEKVDEIISSQQNPKNRICLGFVKGKQHDIAKPDKSKLKFGMFVSSDPDSQSSSFISKDEASTSVQPPKNSKGKNLPNHPPKPKKPDHKTPKVLGGGLSRSGTKKSVQSPVPRIKIDLKTKPQEKTSIPPQIRDIGILGPGPAHLKFKTPKDMTDDVASSSTATVVYEAAESLVTYIPDVSSFADPDGPNFISQGLFLKKSCKVKNRHKKIILKGQRSRDVYIINMDTSTENVCFMSRASSDINWLWHKRLSHLNFKTINQLSNNKLVECFPENSFAKESLCAACEKGKQTRATFKSKQVSTINSPLHLLHMDLFGPVNIQSMGGKRYTLVIVDENSRYTWVFFLRARSDTSQEIIAFILWMEKFNQITVRSIRSDHGTEFKKSVLDQFLISKGISQNFSSVRTPQQNGVAERRNHTLIEAARSMLIEVHLSIRFWAEAVNTACYTQNRSLIVKRFMKTAYELFRGKKPNIEYFHIFGCNCYIKNNRDALGKFDAKADDGFLVGYSTISKAYRVFNKRWQTKEETIHVPENEAPEANIPAVGTSSSIPDGFDDVPKIPQGTPTTSQEDTPSTSSPSEVAPLLANLPQLDVILEESSSTVDAEPLQVVPQPPALRWTRDHPIDQVIGDPSTSVKIRYQASNHCLYVCFLSENEPSKIEEALPDPFWVSAMQEELAEFERNLVWTLVHRPSRKTIIDLKWIF
ncbi:hypothetical protein OSB04_024767 [Centaurea solstitialis]|uniref:Retrovirus-related Pol polyprotein from transposon TNT 1-94 n=1 Tax=Centaurea solstitialis TaxID=347529 RepID=A0AA38WAP1_9ASTR|nr:hypothetical protein OSB04_024767 [Centaurea solstitialis]